jgi:hypothetical protein
VLFAACVDDSIERGRGDDVTMGSLRFAIVVQYGLELFVSCGPKEDKTFSFPTPILAKRVRSNRLFAMVLACG